MVWRPKATDYTHKKIGPAADAVTLGLLLSAYRIISRRGLIETTVDSMVYLYTGRKYTLFDR